MGKKGKGKRPHEPQIGEVDIQSGAKKRQKESGHVQNALDQNLHEASTRSDVLSSLSLASTSQTTAAATVSSPTKTVVENIPHVTQPKRRRPSKTHPRKKRSAELPQLPPIQDKSLEEAVFTHQSYLPGHNQGKVGKSYDRLEFLGDAYSEVFASRLLYDTYPHMPAGRLSQQRENLVKNEALAAHSLAYGFDKRLRLRPDVLNTANSRPKDQGNELVMQKPQNPFSNASLGIDPRSNSVNVPRPPNWHQARSHASKGQQNDAKKQETKIFGDVFEAYVAAVVLSNAKNGYRIAEEWLHKLWVPKLEGQSSAETRPPPPASAKSELAKRVLGKGIRLEYKDIGLPDESESSAGKIWFTVGAFLTGWGWDETKLGEGRALSKSQAGTMAATQALLTPLTEQISNVKKAFDNQVAEERAVKERQSRQNEQKQGAGEISNPFGATIPKKFERAEDQSGDDSQSAASHDSNDSNDSNESGDSDDSDRP